jgi:hypothetical protein
MAKRPTADDMYSGRSYPSGQPHERRHPAPRASDYGRHEEVQAPQSHEDARAANYHNDASGWVRGAPPGATPTGNNQTAMGKPGFDKGQSYRRADGGDNWNSGHDPATIRRPVGGPVTANAKQRRTGG